MNCHKNTIIAWLDLPTLKQSTTDYTKNSLCLNGRPLTLFLHSCCLLKDPAGLWLPGKSHWSIWPGCFHSTSEQQPEPTLTKDFCKHCHLSPTNPVLHISIGLFLFRLALCLSSFLYWTVFCPNVFFFRCF